MEHLVNWRFDVVCLRSFGDLLRSLSGCGAPTAKDAMPPRADGRVILPYVYVTLIAAECKAILDVAQYYCCGVHSWHFETR